MAMALHRFTHFIIIIIIIIINYYLFYFDCLLVIICLPFFEGEDSYLNRPDVRQVISLFHALYIFSICSGTHRHYTSAQAWSGRFDALIIIFLKIFRKSTASLSQRSICVSRSRNVTMTLKSIWHMVVLICLALCNWLLSPLFICLLFVVSLNFLFYRRYVSHYRWIVLAAS